jgi:hypothetical protein
MLQLEMDPVDDGSPFHQCESRHGIAELDGIRRLAFDRTLPPSEALGRIRDAFRSYDEGGVAARRRRLGATYP